MAYAQFIRDHATAALWCVEAKVINGALLQDAIDETKRETKLAGYPSHMRNAVLDVIDTFGYDDLSRAGRKLIFKQHKPQATRHGLMACAAKFWHKLFG